MLFTFFAFLLALRWMYRRKTELVSDSRPAA